jgi:hypothetical protein
VEPLIPVEKRMRCGRSVFKALTPRVNHAALLVACSLLLLASKVHSQSTMVRIAHEVECAKCTIALTKVAEFGSAAEPVLLSPNLHTLAVDSRGRFFSATFDRQQIAVYSPDGKFIQVFGKRGQGPGEFAANIQRIEVGSADSIFVFHRQYMTVFSPNLAYARQVLLPGAGALAPLAVLNDGRVLLGGQSRSSDRIGHPYHLASPTGVLERSFGVDGRPISAAQPGQVGKPLRKTADGRTLWGLQDERRYLLTQWSPSGTAPDSIEITDVPWLDAPVPAFPPRLNRGWDGSGVPQPISVPANHVRLLGVDNLGILWIGVHQPTRFDTSGNRAIYSFRIEAFDPVARRILASQRSESIISLFDGTNLAVQPVSDPDGVARYIIWRIKLVR